MATTDADKIAYCNCMEAVKHRLHVVRSISDGTVTTHEPSLDGEIACLQLRKALEWLAFAALSASRERYEEAHSGVTSEWRAKRILDRLERFHPNFYPTPLVLAGTQPNGTRNFAPLTDGFLSRDDFVFLYDECSEAIHSWNPFRTGPRVIDLHHSFREWSDRIELLLRLHYIKLVDQPELLLVVLSDASDGRVHAYTATA